MLPALVLTAALAALVRATPAATLTASPLSTPDVLPSLTPCAVVKCTANTTCVVISGRATCQPIRRQQCGDVLCPSGTQCCNALCGICVKPGMACVQGCPVKPTLPVLTLTPVVRKEEQPPALVPAEKACGKNVCAEDEECCNSSCGMCVKKGGSCTEQFCDYEIVDPPRATILPVEPGQKCGRNVCGKGEFCCNSSCSQCAPLGGACTMQFCGHEA